MQDHRMLILHLLRSPWAVITSVVTACEKLRVVFSVIILRFIAAWLPLLLEEQWFLLRLSRRLQLSKIRKARLRLQLRDCLYSDIFFLLLHHLLHRLTLSSHSRYPSSNKVFLLLLLLFFIQAFSFRPSIMRRFGKGFFPP